MDIDNKLEAAIGLLALFFFFYQNCRKKKTSLKKNCISLQDKGQVVFEKRQKINSLLTYMWFQLASILMEGCGGDLTPELEHGTTKKADFVILAINVPNLFVNAHFHFHFFFHLV